MSDVICLRDSTHPPQHPHLIHASLLSRIVFVTLSEITVMTSLTIFGTFLRKKNSQYYCRNYVSYSVHFVNMYLFFIHVYVFVCLAGCLFHKNNYLGCDIYLYDLLRSRIYCIVLLWHFHKQCARNLRNTPYGTYTRYNVTSSVHHRRVIGTLVGCNVLCMPLKSLGLHSCGRTSLMLPRLRVDLCIINTVVFS